MISDFFSDDELISELRIFFTIDELEKIDLNSYLSQVTMIDDMTGEINILKRKFKFDMESCDVEEVTNNE